MKINISAFKNFRDFIEDKEWKIVVVASIISFLFVLVLNAYFFLHISKEADKTSGPETGFSIIVFKRELFERTENRLGGQIGVSLMDFWQSFEIDQLEDWDFLELLFKKYLSSSYL